ncbi:CPBP family intramembrane glutamic endopeptidase [Limosilactobacillus allomucosae]|uniref:CPBP family intramembrane glutamic endopeptidase n=1 Tax=Limosilactobacillus allomucosae TaxID=3142938 RepID=UPI0032672E03
MLLINKLLSAVFELLIFSLLPICWWLITARKQISFEQWIGLKAIPRENRSKVWSWASLTSLGLLLLSIVLLQNVGTAHTAVSDFTNQGWRVLPAILVYAVLGTSLPEELLFRGFLLKRLAARFGFAIGNLIQALLFGLLHSVMFINQLGLLSALGIGWFTLLVAWLMGFINEKPAAGSIYPSWMIHALANFLTGLSAALGLL